MKRKWRNSIILGLVVFIFSYFFSLMNNTWQTSLFRAGIGFIIFMTLGLLFFMILDHLVSSKENNIDSNPQDMVRENEADVEVRMDVEAQMNVETIKDQIEETFQSLPLHSLHNGDQQKR